MKDSEQRINDAYEYARYMRYHALEMAKNAGRAGTHLGGGFSAIDIIATLYGGVLNIDPGKPEWEERDRFITSKRHCYLASYTALCKAGFITEEELMTYHEDGGLLAGYPWLPQNGLDFSGGSLGMGLSVGIGMALAAKKRVKNYRVFVLLGDGECNEGAVWEAIMAAPKYQLDNLIAIVDYNHMQFDGPNETVMSVSPLREKFESFGWRCLAVNGHRIEELYDAFCMWEEGRPLAVIANTVKAYGLPSLENKAESHHSTLSEEDYRFMITALKEGKYDRVQ